MRNPKDKRFEVFARGLAPIENWPSLFEVTASDVAVFQRGGSCAPLMTNAFFDASKISLAD
jgi:hypothetical protein